MNRKRIEREEEKKERLAEKQENLLNILKKDKNDTAIKE